MLAVGRRAMRGQEQRPVSLRGATSQAERSLRSPMHRAATPDKVPVGRDTAQYRLRLDRDRRRLAHAKAEFLAQEPTLRALCSWDVCACLVVRNRKEIAFTALEQIGRRGVIVHGVIGRRHLSLLHRGECPQSPLGLSETARILAFNSSLVLNGSKRASKRQTLALRAARSMRCSCALGPSACATRMRAQPYSSVRQTS